MTTHAPSRRVTVPVGSLATGTRRLVSGALRRDPDDRWAAVFGLIAGYSFAVAVVTGILLLPFFRPSMATVVYHGSYAKLDGVPVSQAFRSGCGSHDRSRTEVSVMNRQSFITGALKRIGPAGQQAPPPEPPPMTPPPWNSCTFPAPAPRTTVTRARHAGGSKRCLSSRRRQS